MLAIEKEKLREFLILKPGIKIIASCKLGLKILIKNTFILVKFTFELKIYINEG